MPQMSPLNWLILFFIFSLSFMIFNILNYYCMNKMNKNKIMNLKMNKSTLLNWKW